VARAGIVQEYRDDLNWGNGPLIRDGEGVGKKGGGEGRGSLSELMPYGH